MKQIRLRKFHQWFGITVALFIVIQAGTGLMMTLGLFPTSYELFGSLHYGGGTGGTIYRIFLSIGIIGTAISGILVFFKIRVRSKGNR